MRMIKKSHNKKYKTEKMAKFNRFTLRLVDLTMEENFTNYIRKQTQGVAKIFTSVMMIFVVLIGCFALA